MVSTSVVSGSCSRNSVQRIYAILQQVPKLWVVVKFRYFDKSTADGSGLEYETKDAPFLPPLRDVWQVRPVVRLQHRS